MCSLLNSPDKEKVIKECIDLLKGYDELILLKVQPGEMGYCEAWNKAASKASGDFLIFVSDDNFVTEGNLQSMCKEDEVISPTGHNVGGDSFWGGMFCLPRKIYEKYGLYDMIFNDGIHYMDTDLARRYDKEGVKMSRTTGVVVDHRDPGYTLSKIPDFNSKVEKNKILYEEKWKSEN